MEKILTISIAAYNMEKYIRRALDSLTDERIIEDLEVFVIDDGGSDSTLEIAKEYARKHPSSIFPVHKENGGYGTTVNYSIEHANGKYFKLLDGDDWFDPEGLYVLVNMLKETDCDVILTNYLTGPDEDHLEIHKIIGLEDRKIINVQNLNLKKTMCNAELTFKTALLHVAHLFLPSHMLYTDTIYAIEPFTYVNTLCFYNVEVYCYYIGREGQSMSKEVRKKHRSEQWKIVEILCKSYESKKIGAHSLLYLNNAIASIHAGIFREFIQTARLSATEVNDFKSYDKRIQEISCDIYCSAETKGKTGYVLKWMRRSRFLLFYPIKIFWGLWNKFSD